jgi:fatty-acyl-CoA synthase
VDSLLRSALFDTTDLSTLRKGYYGASIMPVEVLRELARRLPQVRLWNLYGQTEIAPLATMLGPEDQLRKPGSCGRAVLNVETRVVDDAMCDVATGEVGEIVHRSPHLMIGYFTTMPAPLPRSRATGFTPAISRPSMRKATSRWSIARRT